MRLRVASRASVLICVVAVGATACSSSGSSPKSADSPTKTTATGPAVERPAGPAADVSENTGANAPFIGEAAGVTVPADDGATVDVAAAGEATAAALADAGYEQQEFVASGTATSYTAEGELGGDGRWTFTPADSAPYRTRVLVRRPARTADFSGTVVVEWLNVSGGVDANPDWTSLHEAMIRRGDAWVGVSVQEIGVMGGPVAVAVPGPAASVTGLGLRVIDPERYDTLDHPGDGYSFDIYTQVTRAARDGALLDGTEPDRVLAAGESQSAYALVTYYNGVQPLTEAFDGFFVHSRGASALPLVGRGESADLAGSIGSDSVIMRTDQAAPVMELQSESDVAGVLSSVDSRQPDSKTFRLWEVAGTAHADRHLMGPLADTLDCGTPINDGPLHVVAKAAYRGLVRWVEDGIAPPRQPRLVLADGDTVAVAVDEDGIAVGGVRTPPTDVPAEVLSGAPGPNPSTICLLLGSTRPFSAQQLAARYPDASAYMREYRRALAAAIESGVVLAPDRDAMLEYARPETIGE